jgi:hypothetical protein
MSEVVKKVAVGVATALMVGLIFWFVGHAMASDQYVTEQEVAGSYVPREVYDLEVNHLETQLDRMERKLDMLIGNLWVSPQE